MALESLSYDGVYTPPVQELITYHIMELCYSFWSNVCQRFPCMEACSFPFVYN